MRPIRFCMLTTFYPPHSFGGDAVQVQRLARALAERGHEVTVVHSTEAHRTLARGKGAGGEPDVGGDPGIRVIGVDAGVGGLSPLATYLSGRPLLTKRKLTSVLEDEFDVLHFHNPSLLGGPRLLSMGEGIKLYTAHEQWLVCPTHVLWKYQRRVCERPTCWRCTLAHGRPPQPWRSTELMQRSVGALDALIAPSATVAELHARFAGLVRIARLPHFVPDPGPGEDPGPEGAQGERPYFLYVGRLESIKGVGTLIDAFRRRPDERLVIAGTGSLERSLRRAAADLKGVEFRGWVGPEELDTLYRGARAVITPTLGHESFGLVPVEAFARGTPAIVPRFGALAELAEENEAGLTYGSPAELDQALERLSSDDRLRRILSERALAAYRSRWTTSAHLRGYFELIAELAAERGDATLAGAARAARPDAEAVEASA